MYQFNVPDMTCGHCVSTITQAVKSEDPNAKVSISLAQHLVEVTSALAEQEIARRIEEAGYTPNKARAQL